MSDRIIFLDFDGVLNTTEFLRRVGAADVGHRWLDPEKVRLLAELTRRTGALIVLSSSWRYAFTQEELEAMLRRCGFDGAFGGMTPKIVRPRGEEIQAWFTAGATEPTHWVALDDAIDGMAWLGEHHIGTTMEQGLTPEHVERAARLLGE